MTYQIGMPRAEGQKHKYVEVHKASVSAEKTDMKW